MSKILFLFNSYQVQHPNQPNPNFHHWLLTNGGMQLQKTYILRLQPLRSVRPRACNCAVDHPRVPQKISSRAPLSRSPKRDFSATSLNISQRETTR